MFDTLTGAGRDAAEIARLFWIMAGASAAIWIAVTGIALYASRRRESRWTERAGLRLILFAGCVIPSIVLAALLAYGMPVLARHRAAVTPEARVTVIGEQWWWRVRYESSTGSAVELANEVRLPRGRTTMVTLTSTNVIHSFWIPALAGKVDMIPGRITELTLEPTAIGIYRGLCAEYCGASHARMTFAAEVMEPDAFDRWLDTQRQDAAAGDGTGAAAFIANGCAACHTVRGIGAAATIGPDLTHVGGRHSIAAGALPNDSAAIVRFLSRPDHIKPGALMPPFEALPAEQLQRLAAYLRSLQ